MVKPTTFRAFLGLLIAVFSHARFLPQPFVAFRSEHLQVSNNNTLAKRIPIEGGETPCPPGNVDGDRTITDAEWECLLMPSRANIWEGLETVGQRPNFEQMELDDTEEWLRANPAPDANVVPPREIPIGALGGPIRDIWNIVQQDPLRVVPTDESRIIIWQSDSGAIDQDTTYGTEDLCGCTVVLITSPYACVFAHVLEARADDNARYDSPNSPGQQARDAEFIANAENLVQSLLERLFIAGDNTRQQPTVENNWNNFFPAVQTSVVIIAPAWNPEYYDRWPASLEMQSGNYIYPNQVNLLRTAMARIAVRNNVQQVSTVAYRRRYWASDPRHRADDRDLVVVGPVLRGDGRIDAVAFYDDMEQITLAQLAQRSDPDADSEGD